MLARNAAAKSFVLIGHSHLHAIVLGATAAGRPFRAVRIDKIQARPLVNKGGKITLGREIEAEIARAISELPMPLPVSCIGGNVHNMMSLLSFEPAFDFVLSEQPELPLDISAAQILPEEAVLKSIRWRARGQLMQLRCLASYLDTGIAHLESPPPVEDNDFCLANLNAFTHRLPPGGGIAPPILRYKMWRLHSRIFRDACSEAGVKFVPSPPASMDESGFLAPSCYKNATHANQRYGELVIQQLEAM